MQRVSSNVVMSHLFYRSFCRILRFSLILSENEYKVITKTDRGTSVPRSVGFTYEI